MCQKVDEYLQQCSPEQMKIPTREGFGKFIGVLPEKISIWCKKHKEFRQACKKIDAWQKDDLVNLGLFGGKEVNASMAIFLLKANHKMIETERKLLAGPDGEKLAFKVVHGEDSTG